MLRDSASSELVISVPGVTGVSVPLSCVLQRNVSPMNTVGALVKDGGIPLPPVCVYLFGLSNILTTEIRDLVWHSGNISAAGSDDSLHSCCF